MVQMPHLPRAKLTYRDYHLLLALQEHASLGFAEPEVLDRITRKLTESEILSGEQNSDDIVQIGSLVTFMLDGGLQVSSRLMLSPRVLRNPGDISTITPLGMALLGTREGNMQPVSELDNIIRVARVIPPCEQDHEMTSSWHEANFGNSDLKDGGLEYGANIRRPLCKHGE